MRKILAICLIIVLVSTPLSSIKVNAQSSNPNLFVSAEQSLFGNHFSGSMVVEVIVRDSDIASLDNHHGEPDVTLNGKKLRMAQASDGNWYAFFANKDKAMQADQVASTGLAGQSLDFGAFCDRNTDSSILGVSFSETEGVAIPRAITGSTQGTSSFTTCTGPIDPLLPNQNNVVRRPPSLSTNPSIPVGQIGINSNAWPIIQLFSFRDNVSILYNKAGGSQRVNLYYSDILNISLKLDRDGYPKGAEVFVTVNDIQLNQDPTSVDSWTFNIDSTRATFYQAFTETGSNSGNGGLGLVDLNPHLASLGFKDNGNLGVDLGSVIELKTNQRQPSSFVSNGPTTYNKIVTLVETEPNSGIFVSSDYNNRSTIGILSNAPRFQAGSITYNSKSFSIVSATYTAKLSLGIQGGQFNPGQKVTVNLVAPEQNLNPGARDDLDVFRSSATIPSLRIGNPVTLQRASDVKFYAASTTSLTALSGITSVPSSVPDKNSDRLIIDTRSIPNGPFEKITLNLGITAQFLQDLFIDVSNPSNTGTNWLNYDLRSFQNQLGISSFLDTNMTLHFGGLPGTTKIRIFNVGDISGAKGLAQVTNSVVTAIKSVPSTSSVFLEISFDASADTTDAGIISNEQDTQPIVLDFFSFGNKNGVRVNNAIYRAELQETSNNSGIFIGTLEYTMINQLNQKDPALIRSLRTISNEIKFLSNDQLVDEKGVNLAYSNTQVSGAQVNVSTKTDVKTHSGTVTLESQTYRLGQPVVVILNDPDLNTDNDSIQSYTVVNNPASAADDTVGASNGNILLEVLIKGFRYHRCTISGVEYGGLGSTGFTLVETGPATGVFKGSFKMPSQICNEGGTSLTSPVGGNIRVKYHDFRDEFGQQNIFELTFPNSSTSSNPKPLVEEPLPRVSVKVPQIKDSFNRPLLTNPVVGQDLNFVTEISNNDNQNPQSYSYIIQVKDHNNRIVELKWIEGKVNTQSKKDVEILWVPILSGKYTVEVFVWDGIDSAVAIAKKMEYTINVSSR